MKNFIAFLCLLCIVAGLSSCSVVGGIFKAGVWVGVIGVILVIGLIIYFVSRGSNKN